MKIRKLLLKLDDLRVESFETLEGAAAARRTVRAREASWYCDTSECDTVEVCPPSRQPTCGIMPASFDYECEPAMEEGIAAAVAPVSFNGCEYSVDGPCCV